MSILLASKAGLEGVWSGARTVRDEGGCLNSVYAQGNKGAFEVSIMAGDETAPEHILTCL